MAVQAGQQKPLPKTTEYENTESATITKGDLKTAERTGYIWGRREDPAERSKWQNHDTVVPKPCPHPGPHAGGRGTEQGGSRSSGLLNMWPSRSAPGTQTHIHDALEINVAGQQTQVEHLGRL